MAQILCIDVPRAHTKKLNLDAMESIKNQEYLSEKYWVEMLALSMCHLAVFLNELPQFQDKNGKLLLTKDRIYIFEIN